MIYPREFFDLQFTFAEKVCALSGMPLERGLLEYTNLYVRFGLGRAFDPEHPTWRAYIAGLREAEDGREWTHGFYLREPEANTAPPLAASFGCFSYAMKDGGIVRLHFRDAEQDGGSPLRPERADARRAELAALFRHLRGTVHAGGTVIGISWLYNLEAYRRLFPPAYIASRRAAPGRFRSMPLWGQFVDHRGGLKPVPVRQFTDALGRCADLANLERCFPLWALTVSAAAEEFYRFGVGSV